MFGCMKLLINYAFRQQHGADNHTRNEYVFFYFNYRSLVPEVFLDISPHGRAAREPRSEAANTKVADFTFSAPFPP